MRKFIVGMMAAAALAGCNPSAPSGDNAAPAAGGAGAIFPNLFQTAYRAEATITGEDGSTIPVVMIRDGQKMRIEMSTAQGPVATLMNRETGETFVITQAMGRTMVLRSSLTEGQGPDMWWDNGDVAANMTQVGPCTHLGETGHEWARQDDGGAQHTCVTGDGVILWATENGRTTWQTTSLQRGPQDASQFAPPPGAQIVDLGQMGAGMAEAMKAARAAAENR